MTDTTAPRRAKIVLVDDDPELIDRMTQLLEDDYDLVATSDWGTLNRLFFRDGCDLVLMDVNLPVLRGDRLVQILKSSAPRELLGPRPRLIYFSAEDQDKMARLSIETGADGYLSKSLRAPELLKAIANLVKPR
jgi:CheY-like chemotaxis protein